jgi:hypothetical protein
VAPTTTAKITIEPEPISAPCANFPTAEDVNCFLGNLVTQLAFGRIDRKDGVALASISQLLLNTYPASAKRNCTASPVRH